MTAVQSKWFLYFIKPKKNTELSKSPVNNDARARKPQRKVHEMQCLYLHLHTLASDSSFGMVANEVADFKEFQCRSKPEDYWRQ
jgi:hypothetical protein